MGATFEKTRTSSPGTMDSHAQAVERFSRKSVAATYPSQYRPTRRDQRERRAILKALANVARGASILDLPCGTGRLTSMLVQEGYAVTGADASPPMLALARKNYAALRSSTGNQAPNVEFVEADVMNTGFADGQFDAVFCNRLFHHFTESATRQQALKELRRICNGTLIVSYFNSFALDAVKFRIKHAIRRTVPNDRIPIPARLFEADLKAVGWRVESRLATRWGVSPMWYIVAKRA